MVDETIYAMAARGLATSFTESETPLDFFPRERNRFINGNGGYEKRQGIVQVGSTITGNPRITGLHEYIDNQGNSTRMASGNGTLYRYNTTTEDWDIIRTGMDTSSRLRDVIMGVRQIFYNGVDRNFYTDDAGDTFNELVPLIEVGDTAASATTTRLSDDDVEDWTTTDVAENDIVYNVTRDAYAAVTEVLVSGSAINHTAIGSGATGLGFAANNQSTGNRYRIMDMVELNIIPTDDPDFPDNVTSDTISGTDATTILVSGVNFSDTEIKVGDWVRNTTRSAVTQVTSIATAIGVHGITSQTAGDSLVFMKSAMPLTSFATVHFGRLYMVDARNKRDIVISAKDNPQDLTTDAATINPSRFKTGSLQPSGDIVQTLSSFQRFFVIGGQDNTYVFAGTDPVAVSANAVDFEPVGLFDQGSLTVDAMVNMSGNLVFISDDGLQSLALQQDSFAMGREGLSQQINVTLREALADNDSNDIQVVHYQRRSWVMLKVGAELYIFNYAPQTIGRARGKRIGSWHVFDGPLAQSNVFKVLQSGDLMVGGAGGIVSLFDQKTFDDNGTTYRTEIETPWLTLEEPRKTNVIKSIKYIKPLLETGDNIQYTIRGTGRFQGESTDIVTINTSALGQPAIGLAQVGKSKIGGSSVQESKYPLRLRGEVFKLRFETEDALGPDIISRYSLYYNRAGRR